MLPPVSVSHYPIIELAHYSLGGRGVKSRAIAAFTGWLKLPSGLFLVRGAG